MSEITSENKNEKIFLNVFLRVLIFFEKKSENEGKKFEEIKEEREKTRKYIECSVLFSNK